MNLESRKAGTDGTIVYLLWNPFLISSLLPPEI
jgi:hypothetical protein